MPLISLYETRTASAADAWHNVNAPGGYEWWTFDAEDHGSDLRIVATFFDGFIFHPDYLRRYARYRHRPTRHAPPLPSQYRCVSLVIYEADKVLAQTLTHYPPDEFSASANHLSVRIGDSRIDSDDRGSLHVSIAGHPSQFSRERVSAELTFRSILIAPPQERTFFPGKVSGAEHYWVIAAPLCEVTGTIRLAGGDNGQAREIALRGRGYHDHHYGTGPIGPGLDRWFRGHVLSEDRVLAFQMVRPRDRRLQDQIHIIEGSAQELRELEAGNIAVSFSAHTRLRLGYPSEIVLGETVKLARARVIDSSPYYVRLVYEALYHGKKGRAFCEAVYPRRLRWPLFSI